MIKKTLCVCIGVAMLAGCSDSAEGEGEKARESVDIGFIWPYTGDTASTGLNGDKVVRGTIEQINATEGLNFEFNLIAKDSASDPDNSVAATEALIASDVRYFLGPYSSAVAGAILPKIVEAGGVFMNTISWSATLSGPQNEGLYFRPKLLSSAPIANNVKAIKATNPGGSVTVGIFHKDDTYFGGAKKDYETMIMDGCADCVVVTHGWPTNIDLATYDFAAAVTPIIDAAPDAIVVYGPQEGGFEFITEAEAQGYTGLYWLETSMITGDNGPTLFGNDVTNRWRWTSISVLDGPASDAFFETFSELANLNFHYAAIYDGLLALGLAIAKAGSDDSRAVADAMYEVCMSPGTQYNAEQYSDAAAAAMAGSDIDFEGIVSSLDFDEDGELIGVGGLLDGKYVNGTAVQTPVE